MRTAHAIISIQASSNTAAGIGTGANIAVTSSVPGAGTTNRTGTRTNLTASRAPVTRTRNNPSPSRGVTGADSNTAAATGTGPKPSTSSVVTGASSNTAAHTISGANIAVTCAFTGTGTMAAVACAFTGTMSAVIRAFNWRPHRQNPLRQHRHHRQQVQRRN
jgi:hypothetical protein